jgi:hypothetical protein
MQRFRIDSCVQPDSGCSFHFVCGDTPGCTGTGVSLGGGERDLQMQTLSDAGLGQKPKHHPFIGSEHQSSFPAGGY